MPHAGEKRFPPLATEFLDRNRRTISFGHHVVRGDANLNLVRKGADGPNRAESDVKLMFKLTDVPLVTRLTGIQTAKST